MTTPAPSLKALAESKTEGVQKATIFTVDPDILVIENGWNGRDINDDLHAYRQRLKQAMKAGAFIPPVDVEMFEGQPVVRDGHSRTLMARELKAEGVPYALQARQIRGNEAEMRYHMIGSASGRPLTPLEQGRQFALLVSYGQTPAAIAERTGLSRTTIDNGLKLAEAPVAVQQMIATGEVGSHQALKTIREHGTKAGAAKLKAAVTEAKANGKKKATAKQLPQADTPTIALLKRLAAVNIMVSHLDREEVAKLVTEARALVGGAPA